MTLNKDTLNPYVVALVGKDLAEQWWASPNKAFNLQSPESVDLELVKDYLMWHCYSGGG